MNWLFLFLAAIFEVAWTFALKFMKFSDLKLLRWNNIFKTEGGLYIILPFIGYVLFGIGNIYFFSQALKKIQVATAFSVWTAMSIITMKVTEMIVFKEKITLMEILFLVMIVIGIIGLKVYSAA